jgi:hypothetical protein
MFAHGPEKVRPSMNCSRKSIGVWQMSQVSGGSPIQTTSGFFFSAISDDMKSPFALGAGAGDGERGFVAGAEPIGDGEESREIGLDDGSRLECKLEI